MIKIIAVDHGNSSIKTINHTFPAGLADAAGFAEEWVGHNGRQYTPSHRRLPYMRDKTKTEDYLILTKFAIARELDGHTGDIVLAVGLPPAHYRLGKSAFEEYFSRRSPLQFEYNGSPLTVNIKQVLVFPQAAAAAITRMAELKQQDLAYVIDIGGYTIDTLLMLKREDGSVKPEMEHTRSIDGGVNIMCNEIAQALSSQLGVHVEQHQIEAVLRGKSSMLMADAQSLIRSRAQGYAESMLHDLRERKMDLTTTRAFFVGGGALLLRRFIESSNMVRGPVFVEDVAANAKGYQIMAEAVMRQ